MSGPDRREYITAEGAKKLQDELDHLWKVERPRVTKGVADAAAEGDRSENAEYIYGKKKLREIDRRIHFLGKRLEKLTVVTEFPPAGTERIFFGAYVELEDEDGNIVRYRIVGADETDAKRGYISIDSPVAKALLRKSVGDEVVVRRPKGDAVMTVLAVRYSPWDA